MPRQGRVVRWLLGYRDRSEALEATALESRARKGALPLGSYSFSMVSISDRKEYILVLMEVTARGQASGASVTESLGAIATFNEHGKIIREQRFFGHAEALEAVGLSE
jgi:hypothetical protein